MNSTGDIFIRDLGRVQPSFLFASNNPFTGEFVTSSWPLVRRLALALAICSFSGFGILQGADLTSKPDEPKIAAASNEGEQALAGFRLAEGLKANLFAAEPLVANPVCLFVDNGGRVFVCETFRQGKGVTDNRSYGDTWLDADLAAMTVADRRKYFIEQLGAKAIEYERDDDRIRLLIDSNGDGVADDAPVFASGFNNLVDGTGSGVLEHNGDVFFTCIPDLYVLRDDDGDNRAELRKSLYTGFGVRVAFRGHDMHGLCIGPDGRLYFSIGDRGANVETPNGPLVNVESGSVFRCELDGSNVELFATGLRNPQELAFDDYGNLFTGDNNSDSGDKARWVYVVQGGDTGWRMAYQYLGDRGPFNREKIWEPHNADQPAHIVPPIANFADGPSGLDYYPGTGFGDDYKGRFVLVDFRGSPNQSGIRTFRNESDGAFFKLADDQQPIWNILATDAQFGPDGALYVSDWVNGWEGEGKGRIYRFVSTQHADDPIVKEVRELLSTGFDKTPVSALQQHLGHVDRRIRQQSQLELALRGEAAALAEVASASATASVLARLHAIWGLDQISRRSDQHHEAVRNVLLNLVRSDEVELRAHATKLLGKLGGEAGKAAVRERLHDDNARVRFFALMAVHDLADPDAVPQVLALIEANADRDPILRHGGAMALSTAATPEMLSELRTHNSDHVQLSAVVALRRQSSPLVAEFLNSLHERVVVEAARAIHDVPIESAFPALAKLIKSNSQNDALLRRVLNASFRLGSAEQAEALAGYAAKPTAPLAMRLEAIRMLQDWETPSSRDRVLGMWRPLATRDVEPARTALRPVIASFTDSEPGLRLEVGRLASALKIAEGAPVLRSLLKAEGIEPKLKAEALRALVESQGTAAAAEVEQSLKSFSAELRAAALDSVATALPSRAKEILADKAMTGSTRERQTALVALTKLQASAKLLPVLTEWAEGKLPPELQLEALEAAEALQADAQVAELLAKVNATRDAAKPIDQYREALQGGSADKGRTVFFEKVAVSCVRCHKIGDRGGEVGPELTKIAIDKNREYLLEAIVDPNKAIAQGFQSVVLADIDGKVHSGVLRSETETEITLIDAEAKVHVIAKNTIEERAPGKSAMPEDTVKKLTKSELRDLVEFLSTLKGGDRPSRGDGPL